MKKLTILCVLCASAFFGHAQLQTETVTNTVVNTRVRPVVLTPAQLDAMIATLGPANGITAANISHISINPAPDGTNFIVRVTLKQ
jgi:hypothetical protein